MKTRRLTLRQATDEEMQQLIAAAPDEEMKVAYGEIR